LVSFYQPRPRLLGVLTKEEELSVHERDGFRDVVVGQYGWKNLAIRLQSVEAAQRRREHTHVRIGFKLLNASENNLTADARQQLSFIGLIANPDEMMIHAKLGSFRVFETCAH